MFFAQNSPEELEILLTSQAENLIDFTEAMPRVRVKIKLCLFLNDFIVLLKILEEKPDWFMPPSSAREAPLLLVWYSFELVSLLYKWALG